MLCNQKCPEIFQKQTLMNEPYYVIATEEYQKHKQKLFVFEKWCSCTSLYVFMIRYPAEQQTKLSDPGDISSNNVCYPEKRNCDPFLLKVSLVIYKCIHFQTQKKYHVHMSRVSDEEILWYTKVMSILLAIYLKRIPTGRNSKSQIISSNWKENV